MMEAGSEAFTSPAPINSDLGRIRIAMEEERQNPHPKNAPRPDFSLSINGKSVLRDWNDFMTGRNTADVLCGQRWATSVSIPEIQVKVSSTCQVQRV